MVEKRLGDLTLAAKFETAGDVTALTTSDARSHAPRYQSASNWRRMEVRACGLDNTQALGHSTRWRRGGSCDAGRRSPCGRSCHWHAKSPSETPHFRPL